VIQRLLIAITVAIALGAAGIFIVGTKSNPDYLNSRTETYAASQAQIWSFLTRVENQPQKRGQVKKIELLEGSESGNKRWREYTAAGAHIDYEIASQNPNSFLSVTMVSETFGMIATWNYAITPVTRNVTQVRIVELSRVENPWVRGLMILSGRGTGIKQEHRQLADQFGFAIPTP
jgi:hypothetical protein